MTASRGSNAIRGLIDFLPNTGSVRRSGEVHEIAAGDHAVGDPATPAREVRKREKTSVVGDCLGPIPDAVQQLRRLRGQALPFAAHFFNTKSWSEVRSIPESFITLQKHFSVVPTTDPRAATKVRRLNKWRDRQLRRPAVLTTSGV
jgi:hypothetical protein